MFRQPRRWASLACFAALGLGPAAGAGLAAHEWTHHGGRGHEHSHRVELAEAFVHGHVHDEDADDHAHDLTSGSAVPSRPARELFSAPVAVSPGVGAALRLLSDRDGTLPPEPAALGPPGLDRLCVFRL